VRLPRWRGEVRASLPGERPADHRCRWSGGSDKRIGDPLWLKFGLGRAIALHAHNRRCASMKTSRAGQAESNASFTRRTLTVTATVALFEAIMKAKPHP
jgi:hypothetical protein